MIDLPRSLDLSGCYRISEPGLKAVCNSFKNLKSLNVSQCIVLSSANSEEFVEHVANLKHLKHLSMAKITLSPEIYAKLPKLFPNLSSLYLSKTESSTNESNIDITALMINTKVVYARK